LLGVSSFELGVEEFIDTLAHQASTNVYTGHCNDGEVEIDIPFESVASIKELLFNAIWNS